MVSVDVTFDDNVLSRLTSALENFGGGKNMPNTKKAFDVGAKVVQKQWQQWAMGGSVSGAENIKNPSPKLASSINVTSNGSFTRDIGTDSQYMERIQTGTPAYDMKKTYPYGKKSRVSSKNKIPYLIIPFRWGTPNKNGGARAHFGNVITQEVYQILKSKKFRKSSRTGSTHPEDNFRGEPIERSEYDWGDRLNSIGGNMEGMVRMDDFNKSTYFTFRIISPNSKGWVRKAVNPNDVVSAIAKATEPIVNDIISDAMERDLGL